MDTLGEVDLDELHDEYREAVEEIVAAKAEGDEPRAGGRREPARRQGHRPDGGAGEQRAGGEGGAGRG